MPLKDGARELGGLVAVLSLSLLTPARLARTRLCGEAANRANWSRPSSGLILSPADVDPVSDIIWPAYDGLLASV